MAHKGSRARSQSAGRGWNDQLMDAVAVQIANSIQFGSGGKGRRGETFLGKGKGAQGSGFATRQEDNPDDWPCPCGLKVWARKPECPVCKQKRPRALEVKEQFATQGSHPPPTQQAVGTEEDAVKAEEARKRGQLKHIAKTIAGWPEDQKDGAIFKSMQKEAEILKAGLVSAQPSDTQLLGAKEEVKRDQEEGPKERKEKGSSHKGPHDCQGRRRPRGRPTVRRWRDWKPWKRQSERCRKDPSRNQSSRCRSTRCSGK